MPRQKKADPLTRDQEKHLLSLYAQHPCPSPWSDNFDQICKGFRSFSCLNHSRLDIWLELRRLLKIRDEEAKS